MRGPARRIPLRRIDQFAAIPSPVDTTPQAKAHMGGNQVTGFMSGRIADGSILNPGLLTFSRAFWMAFCLESLTPEERSLSLML